MYCIRNNNFKKTNSMNFGVGVQERVKNIQKVPTDFLKGFRSLLILGLGSSFGSARNAKRLSTMDLNI